MKHQILDLKPDIVNMPNPATLVSCDEHIGIAKNVEEIEPLIIHGMITQIKKILGPMVQAGTEDGFCIENELYRITLMKSGLIKILTKE